MWEVYECSDCKGFGCKPPSETCPTCHGNGLVKVKSARKPKKD